MLLPAGCLSARLLPARGLDRGALGAVFRMRKSESEHGPILGIPERNSSAADGQWLSFKVGDWDILNAVLSRQQLLQECPQSRDIPFFARQVEDRQSDRVPLLNAKLLLKRAIGRSHLKLFVENQDRFLHQFD